MSLLLAQTAIRPPLRERRPDYDDAPLSRAAGGGRRRPPPTAAPTRSPSNPDRLTLQLVLVQDVGLAGDRAALLVGPVRGPIETVTHVQARQVARQPPSRFSIFTTCSTSVAWQAVLCSAACHDGSAADEAGSIASSRTVTRSM